MIRLKARASHQISAVVAFMLFTAFMLGVFGRPVLPHPEHACICAPYSTDPSIYMWAMKWWPHALGRGINPLLSGVIWAPDGVNLSWSTSVPSAALFGYPITAAVGPVAAYNIWMLLSPILAAFGIYRLCRFLHATFLAALLGGYIVGFSTYTLGHLLGHLNLVAFWPMPFIVLYCMTYYDGRFSKKHLLMRVVPLAIVQFGFSTELFTTMCAFGSSALIIAYFTASSEARVRCRELAKSLALGLVIVCVLLSPYLYFALANLPGEPLASRTNTAIDVLNVVVPSDLTAVRDPGLAQTVTRNESETVGYLGIPLLLVVGLFIVSERRRTRGRVLGGVAALALVASFGPWLWVGGERTSIPNPLGVYGFLPVVGNALPARFMLYVFFCAGVALALWASKQSGPARRGRLLLAAIAAAFLAPNISHAWFNQNLSVPQFFRDDVRKVLRPGENVVILPYGVRGYGMLWQAETNMYFRMAGGYIGPRVPPAFRFYPIVHRLEIDVPGRRPLPLLETFLRQKDVSAVIAGPGRRRAGETFSVE